MRILILILWIMASDAAAQCGSLFALAAEAAPAIAPDTKTEPDQDAPDFTPYREWQPEAEPLTEEPSPPAEDAPEPEAEPAAPTPEENPVEPLPAPPDPAPQEEEPVPAEKPVAEPPPAPAAPVPVLPPRPMKLPRQTPGVKRDTYPGYAPAYRPAVCPPCPPCPWD